MSADRAQHLRGHVTRKTGVYRGRGFTHWRADVFNTTTATSVWHDDGIASGVEALRMAHTMTDIARAAYWCGIGSKSLNRVDR